MNRTDLIKAIAEKIGLTQLCAGSVLEAINGLAKFKVEHKEARAGRNPATGAAIQIPAKNVVKVTAAKALNDAVN